jgi:hypothetical protein
MNITNTKNFLLSEINEDIGDFKVGDKTKSGNRTTTVTDINPETGSVTWVVDKGINDEEIYEDMTKLIDKFSRVQLKDFHQRPKLIQLVKDLKSIRNKFKRTSNAQK